MVTISDVAKLAGVSLVTVSRVINNADYVSDKTRSNVKKAIAELGYIPSAMARGMRLNRTFTFALILPDITNSFWTTVARGVEDVAQIQDYSILFYNVDEDQKKQKRALETVFSQQVDGVMIAPHDGVTENLKLLHQRKVPTVILDRKLDQDIADWKFDFVRGDSISGAKALTEHLIKLGHRKIAILSGDVRTSTAKDRVSGYRMALEGMGIPYDSELVFFGEYRISAGEKLLRALLDKEIEFSAIFAANNAIGLGVVQELLHRNIRIPDDVAVVYYDDSSKDGTYFPFFTSIQQYAYEIGKTAAELLISRINDRELPSREITLPSKLIVRYSCGAYQKATNRPGLRLPIMGGAELYEESHLIEPFLNGDISEPYANF
ncbi:MAG: LacI family DNA-binding transcriptional regulator [Anaerolineaceae bacterium]|nr:LacI family DNA-binding transcriptional regulator [Anaerolineaceae bacterium]